MRSNDLARAAGDERDEAGVGVGDAGERGGARGRRRRARALPRTRCSRAASRPARTRSSALFARTRAAALAVDGVEVAG